MNKRVLVIDDADDVREVIQISLELMAGFEVMTASFGGQGIEKAVQAQPDAILLDVMLPDMDGLTVLAELQGNPKTQNIPVIFLTAHGDPLLQDPLLQSDAKSVIAKPFKPSMLGQQLKAILGWDDL